MRVNDWGWEHQHASISRQARQVFWLFTPSQSHSRRVSAPRFDNRDWRTIWECCAFLTTLNSNSRKKSQHQRNFLSIYLGRRKTIIASSFSRVVKLKPANLFAVKDTANFESYFSTNFPTTKRSTYLSCGCEIPTEIDWPDKKATLIFCDRQNLLEDWNYD